MRTLLVALALVPAIDLAIKTALGRWLGTGSIRFGPIGEIRGVPTALGSGERLAVLWASWMIVMVPLALLCAWVRPMALPGGVVLGGSLSHLIERSRYGAVRTYICLRGWSPFDLADVAIRIGGVVLAFAFSRSLYVGW
jgi:lipoprotein signal peptidase